jgi:hypothetical protein
LRGTRRLTAGLAAGLATLGVVGLGLALGFVDASPERHGDGDGPLVSLHGGFEAMAVEPVPDVSAWTFGMPLCVDAGTESVTLESVAPSTAVGSGFAVLGTAVREFTLTRQHTPIISVSAWPPPPDQVPDDLESVAGFAVRTPCDAGPSGPYTELLIGLGRIGTDGGGWKGIEVGYTAVGRHRVVVLNHNILICGPAVAADCGDPTSAEPTSRSNALR